MFNDSMSEENKQSLIPLFLYFLLGKMSDQSPYFFMREFSNEELSKLLVTKVAQLKQEKAQTQELNERLEQHLAELEETTCKLEETQEMLEDVLITQIRKIPNITSTNSLSPIMSQGGK